jgi:hypothetical protein
MPEGKSPPVQKDTIAPLALHRPALLGTTVSMEILLAIHAQLAINVSVAEHLQSVQMEPTLSMGPPHAQHAH